MGLGLASWCGAKHYNKLKMLEIPTKERRSPELSLKFITDSDVLPPAEAGLAGLYRNRTEALSIGKPCRFSLIIRASITCCLSFISFMPTRIVGRWLVCPLPFTLSRNTLCLSCGVAAQDDTPCSSLPISVTSSVCRPCFPSEKHKSDYRLVFPH